MSSPSTSSSMTRSRVLFQVHQLFIISHIACTSHFPFPLPLPLNCDASSCSFSSPLMSPRAISAADCSAFCLFAQRCPAQARWPHSSGRLVICTVAWYCVPILLHTYTVSPFLRNLPMIFIQRLLSSVFGVTAGFSPASCLAFLASRSSALTGGFCAWRFLSAGAVFAASTRVALASIACWAADFSAALASAIRCPAYSWPLRQLSRTIA
mmetsp:Transcript_37802/g.90414  ORF Transcript_37802/g.90414 Transcript_37802/m.90414 type:complete len:210 (+) Transcript_37802:274-903(+)